jgi:dUTP pyrophosphatase
MTALVTKIYRDWTDSYVDYLIHNPPESEPGKNLDVVAVLKDYPKYSTDGAGAFDLRAFLAQETVLRPGAKLKISSGLRMQLPAGHSLVVLPRSGSGSHGLVLANTVGLIDQDYRGVVWLTLWNVSNQAISIRPLDRVMQAMVVATPQTTFHFVETPEDFTPTVRGVGGFGSTGAN